MARWLLLPVVLLTLAGCPKRKQPERGVELVFKKTGDVRPVVERRLAQLGLVTRITDDETGLTVRIPDASADSTLGAVGRLLLMPAKLEFCAEVKPVDGVLCASDAGVTIEREEAPRADCFFTGADAGVLVAAAKADVQGRVLVGAAWPDGPLRTFLGERCLSPRVMEAEVKRDANSNRPVLSMTFDAPTASSFADLTGKLVRRRLLVVLDDRVQSAPVVMEAISGGRAMLAFGKDSTEEEITQLGRALSGGPLPGTMELERTGAYGPPTLMK
jgi:hypothetical protein